MPFIKWTDESIKATHHSLPYKCLGFHSTENSPSSRQWISNAQMKRGAIRIAYRRILRCICIHIYSFPFGQNSRKLLEQMKISHFRLVGRAARERFSHSHIERHYKLHTLHQYTEYHVSVRHSPIRRPNANYELIANVDAHFVSNN